MILLSFFFLGFFNLFFFFKLEEGGKNLVESFLPPAQQRSGH